MRLLYSKPSPYSSKVRMAAHLCDLQLDLVPTNTGDEAAELTEANPLGKIPAADIWKTQVLQTWVAGERVFTKADQTAQR